MATFLAVKLRSASLYALAIVEVLSTSIHVSQLHCPPVLPVREECWSRYGHAWMTNQWVMPPELHEKEFDARFSPHDRVHIRKRAKLEEEYMQLARRMPFLGDAHRQRAQAALILVRSLWEMTCAMQFATCYPAVEDAAEFQDSYCRLASFNVEALGVENLLGCRSLWSDDEARQMLLNDVLLLPFSDKPSPVFLPAVLSPGGLCADLYSENGFVDARKNRRPRPRGLLSIPDIFGRFFRHLTNLVINIGAHDGSCNEGEVYSDTANCLAEGGFAGVFIEGDPNLLLALQNRSNSWPNRSNVHIVSAVLTPGNAAKVVADVWPEPNVKPDFLKVDIDIAHDVLSAELVKTFLPKVVEIEVSLVFPPDMLYAQTTFPTLGMFPFESFVFRNYIAQNPSLRLVDSLLKPMGYVLLQTDQLGNAVWVHAGDSEVRDRLQSHFGNVDLDSGEHVWDVWTEGYACIPETLVLRQHSSEFGDYDFRAWANRKESLASRLKLASVFLTHILPEDSFSLEGVS
eukprot:TRINITY_DN29637_c0_g1_i1.p1 TRINITY_DN29637_c0_g1~~TRINITY_DN29637_c0_g1_i1.p1  ORF type:complete len:515 (-),score=58.86 TRINITY_DN29637_c0_g1_i1:549-2093(-)